MDRNTIVYRYLKFYSAIVSDEKQVNLKTDFQRVVDVVITVIMFKLNGSLRLGMNHSSPQRKPYVIKVGYDMYLFE